MLIAFAGSPTHGVARHRLNPSPDEAIAGDDGRHGTPPFVAERPTQYEHWSPELQALCDRAELAIEVSREIREQTYLAIKAWWRRRADAYLNFG